MLVHVVTRILVLTEPTLRNRQRPDCPGKTKDSNAGKGFTKTASWLADSFRGTQTGNEEVGA